MNAATFLDWEAAFLTSTSRLVKPLTEATATPDSVRRILQSPHTPPQLGERLAKAAEASKDGHVRVNLPAGPFGEEVVDAISARVNEVLLHHSSRIL